jgi:hypothetical protein
MKNRKYQALGVILLLINCCLPLVAAAEEKWAGVDETVVGKYAKAHGREKRVSYINTDQGDLLLFVFLLAGVVGGFTAGYSWCLLINKKPAPKDQTAAAESSQEATAKKPAQGSNS